MRFGLSFLVSTILAGACGGATTTTPSQGEPAGPPVARPPAPQPAPQPAGSSGEVPPDRWCNMNGGHTFCSDFDGTLPAEGWTQFSGDAPTVVKSDRSEPNALTIAGPASAVLSKTLPRPGPKEVRASLDLRIDPVAETNDFVATPLAVYLASDPPNAPSVVASVSLDPTKVWLDLVQNLGDGNGIPARVDLAAMPRGRWVRLEIVLSAGAGPTKASVTYDGVSAGTNEQAAFDTSGVDGAMVLVGLLGGNKSSGSAVTGAIDDVLLDVR